MNEKLSDSIKKNKGILRQLTSLNNEIKELKRRVRKLEQKDTYYPTEGEIRNFKIGGTD